MGGQGGIKFLDYSKKKNYKYEKQAVLNKSYFKFFNFNFTTIWTDRCSQNDGGLSHRPNHSV